MPLDLVYPRRLSDANGFEGIARLASDDLYIPNKGTTEVHHISRRGSQWTRLEPKHFVYSVMLFDRCQANPIVSQGGSLDLLSTKTHP